MLGPELINFTARPTPIFLEGSVAIQVAAQAAKDLGLKDGQIVQAVIAARGDMLKLVLNKRELDWPGAGRFKPGDQIELRVKVSPLGHTLVPVARAASTAVSAGPTSLSPRLLSLLHRPDQPSVLATLMRQGGLDSLLGQLGSDAAQLRLTLLHSMVRLSPEVIRRGLANSGLFGEALLGAGAVPSGLDLKQTLRALLRLLPAKSPIIGELERAVDEIEGRQLESVQAQQVREASYSFVMPFVDANPVAIEFRRGPINRLSDTADWVINLHTDSEALGELWLKTTLKSAGSIEMTMWAPRPGVAQMAENAASELEYELKRFGLTLVKLSVLNAPRPSSREGVAGSGQMVDIST